MQTIEKRGRLYLLAFIFVVIVGDLSLKGLLFSAGTLRWSQAGGTIVTLLACWFLWRGSGFAYWFLVVCTALAVLLAAFSATKLPAGVAIVTGTFMAVLLALLLAPATRTFLSSRRTARA